MHTVMTSPVERLRPLTIVGGAEGVGKSTLLRHQLLHSGHHSLAVVVSNLDSLQLDGSDIAARDSTFITLTNGSLCCETDGDVTTTLAMLRRRLHPDTHVLLEARYDASMRRFAGYGYTPGYRLDGTVVVADASSLDGELGADQFSRMRTHIGSAGGRQASGSFAHQGYRPCVHHEYSDLRWRWLLRRLLLAAGSD